jgi:hypothetical protein
MIGGVVAGADVAAAFKALGILAYVRMEDITQVEVTAEHVRVTAVRRDSHDNVVRERTSEGGDALQVMRWPVHWGG